MNPIYVHTAPQRSHTSILPRLNFRTIVYQTHHTPTLKPPILRDIITYVGCLRYCQCRRSYQPPPLLSPSSRYHLQNSVVNPRALRDCKLFILYQTIGAWYSRAERYAGPTATLPVVIDTQSLLWRPAFAQCSFWRPWQQASKTESWHSQVGISFSDPNFSII